MKLFNLLMLTLAFLTGLFAPVSAVMNVSSSASMPSTTFAEEEEEEEEEEGEGEEAEEDK